MDSEEIRQYYCIYERDWYASYTDFGFHIDDLNNVQMDVGGQTKYSTDWYLYIDLATTHQFDENAVVPSWDLYLDGFEFIDQNRIDLE